MIVAGLDEEVVGAWRTGWKPNPALCRWAGPWRLVRSCTPPLWVRPLHAGRLVRLFAGPVAGEA